MAAHAKAAQRGGLKPRRKEKKMKNIFVLYVVETKSGKHYADVDKLIGHGNLVAFLADLRGKPLSADIYGTRKEAEETARLWNEMFEKRGIYGVE